jgi:hypothetical protein
MPYESLSFIQAASIRSGSRDEPIAYNNNARV